MEDGKEFMRDIRVQGLYARNPTHASGLNPVSLLLPLLCASSNSSRNTSIVASLQIKIQESPSATAIFLVAV